MPASLRTLKATIQPDGMVTVLNPSREPNAETVTVMLEPAENLPRFASATELLKDLEK